MSKREKNLIFIMLIMVICFGGFKYFLEPAISTNNALTSEATTLVVDVVVAKEQLDTALATEASYGEAVLLLEDLEGKMPAYRQDEELETMFLDVAKDNDLVLKSFAMEREGSADPETVEHDGGLVLSVITGKNFTITALGDYARYTGLVDDLLAMEDLVIRSAAYTVGDKGVELMIEGTVFMANQ